MGRKSERSKSKRDKSQDKVEKSPKYSRVGRPSRRRKKSDSDDDSLTAQPPPTTSTTDQVEQSEGGDNIKVRKSRRGIVGSTATVSAQPTCETTADSNKPQTSNDWKEDDAFWATNDESKKIEADKGETVWKVQTSNGSGGEIQKLRICRQRPIGGSASAGSDSAESSMSPHKESSSSSPLHKRSLKRESQKSPLVESAENEVLTTSCENQSESNELSLNQADENEFTLPLIGEPVKVIEYVYETQPNFMSIREPSPIRLPLLSPTQDQVQTQYDDNEPVLEITSETLEPDVESEDAVVLQPPQSSPSHNKESELKGEDDKVTIAAVESVSDKAVDEMINIPDNKDIKTKDTNLHNETMPSEESKSRRSSISAPADSESQQVLEVTSAKSPGGREEGEIYEETPPSIKLASESRVVKLNKTNSDCVTPAKITLNRRSTGGETAGSNITKSGSTERSLSQAKATTAKKHPLITGPESDESPSARRRKLTALTSNTRTVVTPTGTTRVRSIPGQALKAVLHAEADNKKDKEKRYKLIKPVKEDGSVEKVETTVSSSLTKTSNNTIKQINTSTTESKLDNVDVREILKSNRDKKLSLSGRKSPISETKSSSRKVSIGVAPVKSVKPERSSSPADSRAAQVLFITNLVRPFTAGQLKELLARTGTIANNGFFIDKIKSKCFVKYIDVEMSIETRHALNGVRWPVSNPKTLKVSYASEKELKLIQDSAEGEIVDDINVSGSWLSSEQASSNDKEKRKSSITGTREWDRGKPKSNSDADVIFVDEYTDTKEEKYNRSVSITAKSLSESHDRLRERQFLDMRNKEKHSNDRERRKRRTSPSHNIDTSPPPARKFKKKDYDAPAKLLDDLFRKTKTTPCLYWLPLSNQQIAIKEEARKKHMAEAERRMAELKKSQKDRERDKDRRRK